MYYVEETHLVAKFVYCSIKDKDITMAHTVNLTNKEDNKLETVTENMRKTKFMQDREAGITVEELRTNLLKKVHSKWSKLSLAKK
jgi:hypothetical protein